MLTLTSPHRTLLHGWRADLKLALLALCTVALFQVHLAGLTLACSAVAASALACGTPFALVWAGLFRPLWPFVALVAVWHGWIGAPVAGCEIILRMLAAVGAANLVTMTTRLSDMQAVVERLARPLVRVGLSPKIMGLAFALVIRFVPVMLLRSSVLREAWRARSSRKPGWRIVFPATLAALDDAERVAEALRARGGAG